MPAHGTCCYLIRWGGEAERHKQTIGTKTPGEKQHEAEQLEVGKSSAGKTQFHSC